jgi:hypothetical protein
MGALILLLAGYVAFTWEPLPDIIHKYYKQVLDKIAPDRRSRGKRHFEGQSVHIQSILQYAMAFGSLWVIGVVGNAIVYSMLTPLRNDYIFESRGGSACPTASIPLWTLYRLLPGQDDRNKPSYDDYIRSDEVWRNKNLESHKSIQPDLRKFLRVVRSTMFAMIVLVLVALIKSTIQGVLWLLMRVRTKASEPDENTLQSWRVYRLYKAVVGSRDEDNWRRTDALLPRNLKVNILILLVAAVTFLFTSGAYHTTEIEYQKVVFYGAESSKTTSDSVGVSKK